MIEKWVSASPSDLGMVLLSSVITYVAILCFTRIAGLRSFSKMSSADFAMTIAVGSLFGATISSPTPTLLVGLVSLAALFTGQWMLAVLRQRFGLVSKLVDNEPLLLMHGETILDGHLSKANVTREDLYGKLREANALKFDEVLAVVFETTGDISVLHSSDPDAKLDRAIFKNVIGHEQIRRYADA